MRILGIDPGLRTLGWGVIEADGPRLSHVANGLCTSGTGDLAGRLLALYEQLSAVVAAHAVVTKDVPPYAVVAGNPAVIKRWRVDPMLISPMLRGRWWRFAPWQLTHLDPSKPHQFVPGVLQMTDTPEFKPDVFDLRNEA